MAPIDFNFQEWYTNFPAKVEHSPADPTANQPDIIKIHQGSSSVHIPAEELIAQLRENNLI